MHSLNQLSNNELDFLMPNFFLEGGFVFGSLVLNDYKLFSNFLLLSRIETKNKNAMKLLSLREQNRNRFDILQYGSVQYIEQFIVEFVFFLFILKFQMKRKTKKNRNKYKLKIRCLQNKLHWLFWSLNYK